MGSMALLLLLGALCLCRVQVSALPTGGAALSPHSVSPMAALEVATQTSVDCGELPPPCGQRWLGDSSSGANGGQGATFFVRLGFSAFEGVLPRLREGLGVPGVVALGRAIDVRDCQRMCSEMPACRVFTFYHEIQSPEAFRCYGRDDDPRTAALQPRDGAITGLRDTQHHGSGSGSSSGFSQGVSQQSVGVSESGWQSMGSNSGSGSGFTAGSSSVHELSLGETSHGGSSGSGSWSPSSSFSSSSSSHSSSSSSAQEITLSSTTSSDHQHSLSGSSSSRTEQQSLSHEISLSSPSASSPHHVEQSFSSPSSSSSSTHEITLGSGSGSGSGFGSSSSHHTEQQSASREISLSSPGSGSGSLSMSHQLSMSLDRSSSGPSTFVSQELSTNSGSLASSQTGSWQAISSGGHQEVSLGSPARQQMASHPGSITQSSPALLSSTSNGGGLKCNGYDCPYANGICCPEAWRSCCNAGEVCIGSAEDPRCGPGDVTHNVINIYPHIVLEDDVNPPPPIHEIPRPPVSSSGTFLPPPSPAIVTPPAPQWREIEEPASPLLAPPEPSNEVLVMKNVNRLYRGSGQERKFLQKKQEKEKQQADKREAERVQHLLQSQSQLVDSVSKAISASQSS